MPITLNPYATTSFVSNSLARDYYKSRYPFKLDFDPSGKFHKELLEKIYDRLRVSHGQMSLRYNSWQEIDRKLTAYIPADVDELNIEANDPRRPISTVVPLSYATMEVLLTYLAAVYMDEPIFRYDYVDQGDAIGAALLELVVSMQTRWFKAPLALHTSFRDNFAYGFGVIAPVWKRKMGFKNRGGFITPRLLYEGNALQNINPYNFLPDVSRSVNNFQDGEFVAWCYTTDYSSLHEMEMDNPQFFNVRYLANSGDMKSLLSGQESSGQDKHGVKNKSYTGNATLESVVVYIDLIPKLWKLGNSERREKWKFEIIGDTLIVNAEPVELDHNMFPVAICATDTDGYDPAPLSNLEVTYGLQKAVDFLYNSHIANVRKAVNDMFIVDPESVNMNDMLNPQAGLLIRLRPRAWGRGIGDVIQQFKVQDVTKQNIDDISAITSITDRASGAVNSLTGMYMMQGERRSATEIRSTRGSALSRLEKKARLAGLQIIQDLAYMVAMHTQQFMSEDVMVKILGPTEELLRTEYGDVSTVAVSASDIDVNFDIVPYDGSLPTTEDPELWIQMLQTAAGLPELAQTMDVSRIFQHFARISGAKNVHQFIRKGGSMQANVQMDDTVLREVEKGNLKPVGQE